MEYAIWNGELVSATEIAKDYNKEKAIRIDSGRKKLQCPDPECKSKLVKYCHGDVKEAYFAHVINTDCDYQKYEDETDNITKRCRDAVYNVLKSKGYEVELVKKLIRRHYAHIVCRHGGKTYAVEFISQNTSANKIEYFKKEYAKIGVIVCWISISGETPEVVYDDAIAFNKRHSLHEAINKDLLIITRDGGTVHQYKDDANDYQPCARAALTQRKQLHLVSSTADLCIDRDTISINGFFASFDEFIRQNKSIEANAIRAAEEEKARQELIAKEKQNAEAVKREKELKIAKARARGDRYFENEDGSLIVLNVNESYTGQEINPFIKPIPYETKQKQMKEKVLSKTEIAIDIDGYRWCKCIKCQKVKIENKFYVIQVNGNINDGICEDHMQTI